MIAESPVVQRLFSVFIVSVVSLLGRLPVMGGKGIRVVRGPIALMAVWACGMSLGKVEGVALNGMRWAVEKPKASACFERASWPMAMPAFAKVVLQEFASAYWKVGLPSPQVSPASLEILFVVWGRSKETGESIFVFGLYLPDSSMAAAVINLNVDPGA